MDGIIGLLAVWAVIAFIGSMLKRVKKAAQTQASDKQATAPAEKPRPAPRKSSVWEQVDMLSSMSMMDDEDHRAVTTMGEGMSQPGSISDYKPMQTDFKPMDTDFTDMKPRYRGKAFVGTEMTGTWSRFSAHDMKKAVVMAEILSRPVSMRQSTGLFQKRRCG